MSRSNPIRKEVAYLELLDSLSDMLSILPTRGEVNFKNTKWGFENSRGSYVELDFSFFSIDNFPSWTTNTVSFLDCKFDLSLEEYVKLIFLQVNDGGLSPHTYQDRLHALKLFFYYIQSVDISCLDKNYATDFYSTLISFDINNNKLIKRLSSASHRTRFGPFNEKKLLAITTRFKAEPLIHKKVVSSLNKFKSEACVATMDITLRDYREGGSLNYLGLETGKHFVDHCANIFQQHFTYASACKRVVNGIYEISDNKERGVKLAICASLMMGNDARAVIIRKKYKPEEFLGFIEEVKIKFTSEFNLIFPLNQITDINLINKLLSQLNLPERYDNQEFIRSLMFAFLEKAPLKSFDSHLDEYKAYLKDDGNPLELSNEKIKLILKNKLRSSPLKVDVFTQVCRDNYEKLTKLTPSSGAKGIQLLNYVLSTVEASGCTLFVALTGWRRSEYGFPLSSIKIAINPEPSDNAYTPYRVHVNWVVPKTSAETKLDREITLGSYLLLKQMNTLVLAQANDPCLYSFNHNQSKDKAYSGDHISRAVAKPWFRFTFEYELFKEIENVKESYLDTDAICSLTAMAKSLREDHLRFAFFYSRPEGLDTPHKKIKAFKNGTLPEKFVLAIQTFLSEETLEFIMKTDTYSREMIISFVKEILGGSLRPTPHAFRHMWAEAVLLRYRGNVGKFIRANFKHLDERFFMSYLRNKETKVVMNIAKRAVINNIVREQMSASRENNGAYVGGFCIFSCIAIT
jgi:hypothetical protein